MAVTRGNIRINQDECKGCGLCVESCPPKVLFLSRGLNRYGVHALQYQGEGCTGCGICFYCCPEPGAITVLRIKAAATIPASEKAHAATV